MPFSTRHSLILVAVVLFTLYCLFQARFLILGPQVSIASHEDGAVVESTMVTLDGSARNAAWLSLNGRQIFTDTEGAWSEKLLLSEGLSIMTLLVRDRFGRERMEQISLVLN